MENILNFEQFIRLQEYNPDFRGKMRWHFDDRDGMMQVQLLYDDLEMRTSLFQPKGYPSGYTVVAAGIQLFIGDFILRYNQEKPIFRAILYDKVPLLMKSIENASKQENDSCYLMGGEDHKCDLFMPFILDSVQEDRPERILMHKSVCITRNLLKMLLQVHTFINSTKDTHFSYLGTLTSDFQILNNYAFLDYAYHKIPDNFVSVY